MEANAYFISIVILWLERMKMMIPNDSRVIFPRYKPYISGPFPPKFKGLLAG
jgi:hypothetical protein